MLKFLKKLEDSGALSLIDGLLTIMWFGYMGRLILAADIGAIPKSLILLVGLWFAFDHVIHHHMGQENEE